MLIRIVVEERERLFLGGLWEWGVISLIGDMADMGMGTRKKIRRLCWRSVGMLRLILC